jgi:hypothetical protein
VGRSSKEGDKGNLSIGSVFAGFKQNFEKLRTGWLIFHRIILDGVVKAAEALDLTGNTPEQGAKALANVLVFSVPVPTRPCPRTLRSRAPKLKIYSHTNVVRTAGVEPARAWPERF